jgi:hypothetical protein
MVAPGRAANANEGVGLFAQGAAAARRIGERPKKENAQATYVL